MAGSVRERLLNISTPEQRIMAALDHDTEQEAMLTLVQYGRRIASGKVNSVADLVGVKRACRMVSSRGAVPFVDYKLHDIDETMRKRARNLTLVGGGIITLHALADRKALEAASAGVDQALDQLPSLARPLLLAVTVLTSHDEMSSQELFGAGRSKAVQKLAHIAADAGIEGLVCSPREAEMLKHDRRTEHMVVVSPAIRPSYAVNPDEQATATTPRIAMEAGADFLVIGRPLTESKRYGLTGTEALNIIAAEIGEVV